MPKAVRYASRFEFLREAAFRLVARDGPHALTRRARFSHAGLVPDDDSLDDAIVWLRLLLAHATVEPPPDPYDDFRDRYQVADVGYSVPRPRASDGAHDERARAREAMSAHVARRREESEAGVLRLLGDADPLAVQIVLALVDGLTLAVCTGRLSSQEARSVLDAQVRSLSG